LHFAIIETLVVVTDKGSTELIGGIYGLISEPFEVYLIEIHVETKTQIFDQLQKFGKGSNGLVLKMIINL